MIQNTIKEHATHAATSANASMRSRQLTRLMGGAKLFRRDITLQPI
jgi:hypothetical protein